MEERWEASIHTLDVGQGDCSLIQIKKLRKIEGNPEDYLEDYIESCEEEGLHGYKGSSPIIFNKRMFYNLEGEQIIDTSWEYNILIDGGEEGQEEKILHSINKNVKFSLDAVIITHADTDHYGGVYAMLAKNNFWHVCKVIYFTAGQEVIGLFSGFLTEAEPPEDWMEKISGAVNQAVTAVIIDLLEFSKGKERDWQKFFIEKFIEGILYVIEEKIKWSIDFGDCTKAMEYFFEDTDENGYAVKFLYQRLMEDRIIRSVVGEGVAEEGYEIHTRLSPRLTIYMSEHARKELFTRKAQFRDGIYTGWKIAAGISVNKKSRYWGKYGVNRYFRVLSFGDINMDFLEDAADKLEPEIVPVKMVLAAADQYADSGGEYCIHGDSNKKNCSSIAVLLQMGGFIYYSGGDLPWDGEKVIAENCETGKYEVRIPVPGEFQYYMAFKAGHHGSSTATSDIFLDKFKPGHAVISCGDHTEQSGKRFEFPAKETVLKLVRRNHIQNVFTTAYPNVDEEESEEIERSKKVVVTGYFSEEAEEKEYDRSGDMVCTVQAFGPAGAKECLVQMEAYVGEAEKCTWTTYPLSGQAQAAPAINSPDTIEKAPFVLIPGVLEFDDIRPMGEGQDGFTAEFTLGGKVLSVRFANMRKWKCYEGTLSVLDNQVLGLGDMLRWAGGLFPGLQVFSGQEEWNLDSAGIDSIYLFWNAWAGRIVRMRWHGRVTVGGFSFSITFTMPEYRMELELRPGQKLTVEDCLEKAGLPKGALGFFGSIGMDSLTLQVSPFDKSCNMVLRLGTKGLQEDSAERQPGSEAPVSGIEGMQPGSGISFDELALQLGFRKGQGVQAGMKGILSIGGMSVKFLAFYEGGDWTLSGEMKDGEGISLDAVLACMAKEAGAGAAPELPGDFRLSYVAVDISTGKQSWELQCGGYLVIEGTELDLGLAVQVQTAGGQRELSVAGTAELLGVDFSCVFEKVRGRSATLFYVKKEEGITLGLQELVRLFDENITLPVDVKLLMQEAAVLHLSSGGMVFQAVLGGELELSLQKIPVVGGFLPERADFKLDSIKIGYIRKGAAGEAEEEDMAEAGHILAGYGLSDLPKQAAGGFFLEITADVGGEKIAYLLGGRPEGRMAGEQPEKRMAESAADGLLVQTPGQEAGIPAIREGQSKGYGLLTADSPASEPAAAKSFAVNKKLGPLELHRITIMLADGKLWFTPDATVSMGGFLVDFTDVSMGISLEGHTVSARMNGMGMSYKQAGLTLAAEFSKASDEAMLYRYDGTLSVQASKWQLTGMGSYGKMKDGTVSFYLFLDASMRIVLHPSLILTGVMAGAGIHKSLRVPDIKEVEKFPLLAGGSSPLAVFDDLNRNWLVSGAGKDWLAVGVRFRIAELLDGKALLMANLGSDPEFSLLGLCELELPKKSSKPYLHIALQLRADLKPASGVFSVEIAVGKSSYLLCPDCHITGGAAFYTWFAPSVHHGDFVVTVGGYHPAFTAPAHYPKVDRVGIAWQVSAEVSLKGEAYFALTPSCAMAGANLSVTYEKGNLKAWFAAWANFLVAWKPFRFQADIGVNLGVSYRMSLLGFHKTLSVSIGGSLRLWGPPTGGKVKIHLWFISFTVSFGADGEGEDSHKPLSWKEFQELLPQGGAIQIHPMAGLESQSEDGMWLVRGKDFRFAVESSVPASSITAGQEIHKAQGEAVHIRPMDLTAVDTGMKVRITHRTAKTGEEAGFVMEEKRQRVAESLWGTPLYRDGKFVQSGCVPAAGLLDGCLTGAEFMARGGRQGTEVVIDDLDALSVLRKAEKGTKISMRLVDYRLPVLKAGQYDITVEQGMRKEGRIQEKFPSKVQSFYVGGCRFGWKKGTVVNTYPPKGSAGSFSNALPHVVLADSMLPWERQYGAGEETPWLALFLLRRDEIDPGENGDGTQSMTVNEFCRQAAGIARPAAGKEPGVDGTSVCNVLTLPADIFRAILPSEQELCLLCHGRETDLSARAEDFGSSADDGGFSVVMANRLPGTGEYTGYLVSLEGAEELGETTEGKVQLICMDSFTFRSTEGEAEDFYHMASALLRNNRGNVNFGSGMGEGSTDGYCLARYHTGAGTAEQRRFRGILKPVGAEDTQEGLAVQTAVSMGRMMALGKPDFIAGMLQYRERMSELASRMMRLCRAGAVQEDAVLGLADSRDAFRAVRGADGSIMNLLKPVRKRQRQAGIGNGEAAVKAGTGSQGPETVCDSKKSRPEAACDSKRRRPDAVYGVLRGQRDSVYSAGGHREEGRHERVRRQADEVCRCLSAGRDLAAAEEPKGILDRWLEDLLLLKGIPFACLLPSEKLLPPENVRFFQIDKAWLQAMASGAAGIGENCRKQSGVTQELLNAWKQRIGQAERYGVLLRTDMLRLWKNLAIYVCNGAGEEVKPLRMERLSEDILLILCEEPLTSLKIREPSEGIRMQFNEDGTVHARNPRTGGTKSGVLAQGEKWKWFRDNGSRILNVAGERGLADMFTEHFGRGNLPEGKLTPAGFALQFAEGTRSVAVEL